jgi:hypothetical protein
MALATTIRTISGPPSTPGTSQKSPAIVEATAPTPAENVSPIPIIPRITLRQRGISGLQ